MMIGRPYYIGEKIRLAHSGIIFYSEFVDSLVHLGMLPK